MSPRMPILNVLDGIVQMLEGEFLMITDCTIDCFEKHVRFLIAKYGSLTFNYYAMMFVNLVRETFD